MINKRGFEFSFAWLFAILVGAVIIFIAVFATTSLIDTSRTASDTQVAAQLGALLNPIETNLEDSKYAVITFPDETRFYNRCRDTGPFGRQIISTSVKSGIGREFKEPEVENSFFNKYIFSREIEQGDKLHLFVKPFEFPYKVADLVFASSGEYCFVNPPDEILEEVSGAGVANVKINISSGGCSARSIVVCFNTFDENCDIKVKESLSSVEKDGEELFYSGPLMYGAIFAEPEIYECQVKRLMKRTGELSQVYASKSEHLSGSGCSSSISGDLRSYGNFVQITENESSANLISNSILSKEIGERNANVGRISGCRLF